MRLPRFRRGSAQTPASPAVNDADPSPNSSSYHTAASTPFASSQHLNNYSPQDGETGPNQHTTVVAKAEDNGVIAPLENTSDDTANGATSQSTNEKNGDDNEKDQTLTRTVSNATATTDGGEPGEDDESQYPKAFQLTILTFGLCMATFVVALDNTIIATAIPKITTVFDSLNDVGWYGSSYLLTTTSLQPSFGKVYTYFNVKWTYIFALSLFEVGSVICAAAKSSTMLIVGRAVAGAGAAALFSGGMTIIAFSVPLRKRAIYIALLSSMFGISSVIGPILGGAFTDRVSWRWCFWINLPFGAIAIGTVGFFFKNPVRKHSKLTTRQKNRTN